MKSLLGILLLCLTSSLASADLLDRMKLEDSFRTRIEDVMKIYDAEAKVMIRFDVKGFDGVLPGTTISQQDSDVAPLQLNSSDISRVVVEVYSQLDSMPAEAKELIYKVLPIDKQKVRIDFKKSTPPLVKTVTSPLDPQALSEITRTAVEDLSRRLWLGLGLSVLVLLSAFVFVNSRRTMESRRQMEKLSQVLSELSTSGPSSAARDVQPLSLPPTTSAAGPGEESSVEDMPIEGLEELLADCYWCGRDAYAHWLWQNISSARKQTLLSRLSFLRDYSPFFVDLSAREEQFHHHPYYLNPLPMKALSQKDLTLQVKKNLSLWHCLSPLRQGSLNLTFEERIKAVQTSPGDGKLLITSQESAPRDLERRSRWSDLSADDEKMLFLNPEIVPSHLRANVKSLVWLSQKPATHITDVLARFDARSLAEGWVGPQELLQNLESYLPEKKLKLLHNYRQRTTASRTSPIFHALVEEGLKNEAA